MIEKQRSTLGLVDMQGNIPHQYVSAKANASKGYGRRRRRRRRGASVARRAELPHRTTGGYTIPSPIKRERRENPQSNNNACAYPPAAAATVESPSPQREEEQRRRLWQIRIRPERRLTTCPDRPIARSTTNNETRPNLLPPSSCSSARWCRCPAGRAMCATIATEQQAGGI